MSSSNMTTTQKLLCVLAGVILAVGAFGGYKYLFAAKATQQSVVGTSAQGSTGTSAKQASIYGINLAAPGANATSSSVLNQTGNDLYVTAVKATCEGVGTSKTAYTGAGLAALTVAIATSSTAAPATNANTNYAGATLLTIATSTPSFGISSSTMATPGSNNPGIIWANNSYMTFTSNATNTAICTFAADYTSA